MSKVLNSNSTLSIFALILLGLICYSNAINNDFVWDDKTFIIANPATKSLTNLKSFFFDRTSVSSDEDLSNDVYRPLTTLSFAIDYHFFKYNPIYYHLENIFFHIANTVLLYFLLNAVFRNPAFSFIGSLIFLVHPVQTEAVSWISGRSVILFLFFYLSAFIFYVKYRGAAGKTYLFSLSLISFACSLLSKEMAATLPLILILYEIFLNEERFKWKSISKIGFYFIVLVLYMGLRHLVLGTTEQKAYWGGSFYRTMLTMSKGIVYYLKILFFPTKLCAGYVVFISKSLFEIYVLMSLIIILVIMGIFVYLCKRNKVTVFGIGFFFITLLPVSNIIPIKFFIAERCLYLPSIGYSIIVASIILSLVKAFSKDRSHLFSKVLTTILVIPLIGSFAVRTYTRNYVWKDEESLFRSIVKCSPYNSIAYYNLGNVYYGKDDIDLAIDFYRKSIKLNPGYIYSHLGLANALHTKKRYEEALEEYKIVLKIKPTASCYNSLGVLSFDQNNYIEAVEYYKKALTLDNNYVKAYINLGNAYIKLNELQKAKDAWKKALSLNASLKYLEENIKILEGRRNNFP